MDWMRVEVGEFAPNLLALLRSLWMSSRGLGGAKYVWTDVWMFEDDLAKEAAEKGRLR